jgi:8-oxo-dGTP pyrophosphatase MutT (NUDIX family)
VNKPWQAVGRLIRWLLYPFIWLALKRTARTRLFLRSGDQLLLVKNWLGNGKWSLPGGGIKAGETPLLAVCREVFEETGLKIAPELLKPLFIATQEDTELSFPYHCFQAELTGERPEMSRRSLEIAELAWLPWQQLSAVNANPDVLRALTTWRS